MSCEHDSSDYPLNQPAPMANSWSVAAVQHSLFSSVSCNCYRPSISLHSNLCQGLTLGHILTGSQMRQHFTVTQQEEMLGHPLSRRMLRILKAHHGSAKLQTSSTAVAMLEITINEGVESIRELTMFYLFTIVVVFSCVCCLEQD